MTPFIAEALGAAWMKYYDNFDRRKVLQRKSLYVCMIGEARGIWRETSRQKVSRESRRRERQGEVKRERSIEGEVKGERKRNSVKR